MIDSRSNGTTIGHDVGVLPQGMMFDAVDLMQAYVDGARSGRHHQPSDELIERAADAYVKLAHIRRLS